MCLEGHGEGEAGSVHIYFGTSASPHDTRLLGTLARVTAEAKLPGATLIRLGASIDNVGGQSEAAVGVQLSSWYYSIARAVGNSHAKNCIMTMKPLQAESK